MKSKLTKEENLKKILRKKVEKVLFNEQNLVTLKELIHKVSTGEIPAKILREAVLDFRSDILEELLKELLVIFEFYAHQTSTQDQLSEFTSLGNSQMAADLQEKNEFLTNVASRVSNVYKKVKEKLEPAI